VADKQDTAERSEGVRLPRNIPALVAGFLGSLALVAYPLGFIAYWVQIWREYTHDATTALYAAALIPVPVAAGGALGMLQVAFFASSVATGAALAVGQIKILSDISDASRDEALGESRLHSWFLRLIVSRGGRVVVVGLAVGTAALAPLVFELIVLDSGSDVFLYACGAIVAGSGGLIAAWLIFYTEPSIESEEEPTGDGHDSRSPVQGIIVLATATIIAAGLLIPLQSPALATVRFSAGGTNQASLIAHSAGYWYVVERGETDVVALPDKAVGEVTISDE
jgi:hypothetical protein